MGIAFSNSAVQTTDAVVVAVGDGDGASGALVGVGNAGVRYDKGDTGDRIGNVF